MIISWAKLLNRKRLGSSNHCPNDVSLYPTICPLSSGFISRLSWLHSQVSWLISPRIPEFYPKCQCWQVKAWNFCGLRFLRKQKSLFWILHNLSVAQQSMCPLRCLLVSTICCLGYNMIYHDITSYFLGKSKKAIKLTSVWLLSRFLHHAFSPWNPHVDSMPTVTILRWTDSPFFRPQKTHQRHTTKAHTLW